MGGGNYKILAMYFVEFCLLAKYQVFENLEAMQL